MGNDDENILQRRIRKRLEELNLNQFNAAKKAGLRRDAIRSILRKDGTKSPRAETLVAIARALEVPFDYLADTRSQGVVERSDQLDLPNRAVPVLSLDRLAWHAPGKPLESENTITISDHRHNLAAFRLVGSELSRVVEPGATCIVDLDDTAPRDGAIYVFKLNTVPGVRFYRDSDGPRRLEADSYERYPVLYVTDEDDFHVIGRVDEFIVKAPNPSAKAD